jgi:hypothetical protein
VPGAVRDFPRATSCQAVDQVEPGPQLQAQGIGTCCRFAIPEDGSVQCTERDTLLGCGAIPQCQLGGWLQLRGKWSLDMQLPDVEG